MSLTGSVSDGSYKTANSGSYYTGDEMLGQSRLGEIVENLRVTSHGSSRALSYGSDIAEQFNYRTAGVQARKDDDMVSVPFREDYTASVSFREDGSSLAIPSKTTSDSSQSSKTSSSDRAFTEPSHTFVPDPLQAYAARIPFTGEEWMIMQRTLVPPHEIAFDRYMANPLLAGNALSSRASSKATSSGICNETLDIANEMPGARLDRMSSSRASSGAPSVADSTEPNVLVKTPSTIPPSEMDDCGIVPSDIDWSPNPSENSTIVSSSKSSSANSITPCFSKNSTAGFVFSGNSSKTSMVSSGEGDCYKVQKLSEDCSKARKFREDGSKKACMECKYDASAYEESAYSESMLGATECRFGFNMKLMSGDSSKESAIGSFVFFKENSSAYNNDVYLSQHMESKKVMDHIYSDRTQKAISSLTSRLVTLLMKDGRVTVPETLLPDISPTASGPSGFSRPVHVLRKFRKKPFRTVDIDMVVKTLMDSEVCGRELMPGVYEGDLKGAFLRAFRVESLVVGQGGLSVAEGIASQIISNVRKHVEMSPTGSNWIEVYPRFRRNLETKREGMARQ